MTQIIVSIPEYGVEQALDPATGSPWASQEVADLWAAQMRERLAAAFDASLGTGAFDLTKMREDAREAIDIAAGRARTRYITSVPGQEAVYLRKVDQARAFIAAAGEGTVPPYVAAEAAALGVTPIATAEGIVEIAQLWEDLLSPAIEAIRIGSKRRITAAAGASDRITAELIAAERKTALEALAAI